jgi:heme exporter protein C
MWKAIKSLMLPGPMEKFLAMISPWVGGIALLIFIVGAIWGLWIAPPDYQQQDAYRIIFVHVPCAFLSLGIYASMALASLLYLIFRVKMLDKWVWACAPIGALFTALALITGAIWGKPMWGTWWVWDARLTSELILLFIYLGVIFLKDALRAQHQSLMPAHILTVVGFLNIPIVHFSVQWWHTLHQGPTLSQFARPDMAPEMLSPLLTCILAFKLIALYMIIVRLRVACYEDKK